MGTYLRRRVVQRQVVVDTMVLLQLRTSIMWRTGFEVDKFAYEDARKKYQERAHMHNNINIIIYIYKI